MATFNVHNMDEYASKRASDCAIYVVENHEDNKIKGLEYYRYISFSEYNGYMIGKQQDLEYHVMLNGFIYTMRVTEEACRSFIDNANAANGDEADYGIAKEKCKAMEAKIARYIVHGTKMPCTDMAKITGWPGDRDKKGKASGKNNTQP